MLIRFPASSLRILPSQPRIQSETRRWQLSRTRQFDGREIEIIDGLPDRSSRTSVETREREPGSRDDRRGDEPCFAATHVFRPETASVPSLSWPSRTSPSGGREKRGHP